MANPTFSSFLKLLGFYRPLTSLSRDTAVTDAVNTHFFGAPPIADVAEVGKLTAYSVLVPPTHAEVGKLTGYAVLAPPLDVAEVGKLTAYSVLEPPTEGQVGKLTAYSVLVPPVGGDDTYKYSYLPVVN